MIVLRSIVAILSSLALTDCGGLHACTTDGVPCEEAALHPRPVASSGGVRPSAAPLFPTANVAANAPFVAPPMPEAAPEPAVEVPPPQPTATATDPTAAPSAEQEEDTGRHHRRHGRHGRHGGGHHSSSGSRHHRRR